jgi:TPP-dependent pyruvate/acetoin dehydrogenase alpha subunit
LPHMISKGIDPKYYLAEHTGKETGFCRGMSTFHSIDTDYGLIGGAGTIGSGFPVTVGLGLAAKMNERNQVAVCCFGDGTSNRGTFHECALMVNNWKLPVIFVCENNGLGMFVPVEESHPVKDIASLAQGYGMPAAVVDGQDVIAVAEAVMVAVERAREGAGPSMVECKCLRFCAHAVGVPDFRGGELRSQEEIAEMRKRDPIKLCQEMLLKRGVIRPVDVERIDEEAAAEVADAEKFADGSAVLNPSLLDQLLYS